MDRNSPVGIDVFIKVRHPYINIDVIDFLVKWRNCVISNIPFTGWAKIQESEYRKILISLAQQYSTYLVDWADDQEGNIHYNSRPSHRSDVNPYM